jgi:hypothetical protein
MIQLIGNFEAYIVVALVTRVNFLMITTYFVLILSTIITWWRPITIERKN